MTNVTSSYQPILTIFENSEIQSNMRDAHEVIGFICAIAALPEPLALPEWLPLLWKKEVDPSFSEQTLAADFAAAVLQFHENCLLNYQACNTLDLPEACWLNAQHELTAAGNAFATGYLSAFNINQAQWQSLGLASGSEAEQLLQTSMLLLSKMATPKPEDERILAVFEQLPDMPEIVGALPQLLSTLGRVANTVNTND